MVNLEITGTVGVEVVPDNTPINTEGSITILLMGATGSGKSSFVETLSNDTNLRISGDQLEGATQKLTVYKIHNVHLSLYPINSIYIVDTAGFSDRKIPESKALRMVQDWMKKSGCEYIDRILYFDRITDPRMAGSKARMLALFQAITGEKTGRSVTFVTTMWNTLWKKEQMRRANKRFEELSQVYYKDFLSDGSRIVKFWNNHTSALSVVRKCLARGSDNLFGFELHMLAAGDGLQTTARPAFVSLLHANLIRRREALQHRLSDVTCDLEDESARLNSHLMQAISEEMAELRVDLQVVQEELEVITTQTILEENLQIQSGCPSAECRTSKGETGLVSTRPTQKAALAFLGSQCKGLRHFVERKMKRVKDLILHWLAGQICAIWVKAIS